MSTSRYKIATITDEITALGLKLAGIGEVATVKENESASDKISNFANDDTIAVLMITEKLAAENRKLLDRIIQRPWPVIVEIPGPEGKMDKEESTIKELVRRALGIEMDI